MNGSRDLPSKGIYPAVHTSRHTMEAGYAQSRYSNLLGGGCLLGLGFAIILSFLVLLACSRCNYIIYITYSCVC